MTADFSLDGQIALVTGASSGLGRSFAGFLAKAGASVVLASRHIDQCAKAADQITGTTLPISIDVTDPTSINAALRTIEQNFGTVTILINNAGTVTNNLLVET
ncbi:MAG: SDR family NAD(P)-dependent oxidoreductase, partial [Pseudomonadota bacterium]|nr:SDR family NAD(P)-dependent oxidoreductase [Pseudomonadota bacterium]